MLETAAQKAPQTESLGVVTEFYWTGLDVTQEDFVSESGSGPPVKTAEPPLTRFVEGVERCEFKAHLSIKGFLRYNLEAIVHSATGVQTVARWHYAFVLLLLLLFVIAMVLLT